MTTLRFKKFNIEAYKPGRSSFNGFLIISVFMFSLIFIIKAENELWEKKLF